MPSPYRPERTVSSATVSVSHVDTSAASGMSNDASPYSGSPVGPARPGGPSEPGGPSGGRGKPEQNKSHWFKDEFRPHFDDWVMGPIERLAPGPDALVAFILMSCAIDYLAGFWYGASTKRRNKHVYKKFVESYLPNYDADGLYDSLRNGLVHLFTIKGRKYALKHNAPASHLKPGKDNQLILNSENFLSDLIRAKNRYFDAVEADPHLLDKAWDRYTRDGFLNLVEV